MFDNDCGGLNSWGGPRLAITEFTHCGECRLEIQEVVGAQLLALELDRATPALLGMTEPTGFLMGVFPVAEGLAQRHRLQPGAGIHCNLIGHPGADGGVVGRCVLKRLQGQLTA